MRDVTVDILKGIGILTVVLCHNWILYNNRGELSRIVFSFHMPLFFFISGLFFKPNQSFTPFLIHKADTLLKPFFVVLLGYFVVEYLHYPQIDVSKKLIQIAYASESTITLTPLWFLSHLFVVFIFAWVIHLWVLSKISSDAGKKIFLLGHLFLGVQLMPVFWNQSWVVFGLTALVFGEDAKFTGLPFNLDIIPVTTAFFLSGHLYAKDMLNFKFKSLYALLSLITFSALHFYFNETLELNAREYGNFIICTMQVILGIYLVFSLASLIKNFKILSKVFSHIGIAILMILIVHFSPQHVMTGILQYHLPDYKFTVAFLSLIASIIISLIFWEITLKFVWLTRLMLPIKNHLH